jgi:hypothetical protein
MKPWGDHRSQSADWNVFERLAVALQRHREELDDIGRHESILNLHGAPGRAATASAIGRLAPVGAEGDAVAIRSGTLDGSRTDASMTVAKGRRHARRANSSQESQVDRCASSSDAATNQEAVRTLVIGSVPAATWTERQQARD